MRRDGEKPVRPLVAIDIGNVVGNLLRAQDDRGALNPGASLETAEHEFGRHGNLRSGIGLTLSKCAGNSTHEHRARLRDLQSLAPQTVKAGFYSWCTPASRMTRDQRAMSS